MAHDRTEELADLRDEMDVAVQSYEFAASRVPPVTGRDGSGTVAVLVDPAGTLTRITLTGGWRREVGPEGLAGALAAAMAAAAAARGVAWAEALAAATAEPPGRARPMPLPGASLAGSLDALTVAAPGDSRRHSTAALEALLEIFRGINDGIDQVSEGLLAHSAAEFTGQTPSDSARATVTGSGELRSVALDHRWLDDAHDSEVSRAVTEAVRSALARAAERGLGSIVAASSLGAVGDLGADSRAMAARLGLGD